MEKKEKKVRVRFAPSPTGALHIGGVRTALYNYLFARQHGGTFILRIEDTDSGRFVPGAEEYIVEALKWAGIVVDEGVGVGGPHAPYRQSERAELYLKYALELVDKGDAYYAFDTPQELNALREADPNFSYNAKVRNSLQTSLHLGIEETQKRIEAGQQWVIRYKMPESEVVVMEDRIRGHVEVDTATLDDKVLYKSADKLPTYHLANIVDDHLMETSHVIRGEEWLPSLPLHVLLYRSFGWAAPEFAHLPLILKPDGKGKLSKRDGDRLGFAVFPLLWQGENGETARGFREDGYLPEAFINMLALLGWSPGDDRELLSMDEMIEAFSLDKVSKSGARFDPDKARWINGQYIHHTANAELAQYLELELRERGLSFDQAYIEAVCGLIKERATLLTELWGLASFYFVAPSEYDQKMSNRHLTPDGKKILAGLIPVLMDVGSPATAEEIEAALEQYIFDKNLSLGQVMPCLRLALVGQSGGASCDQIVALLGIDETIDRIDQALNTLS